MRGNQGSIKFRGVKRRDPAPRDLGVDGGVKPRIFGEQTDAAVAVVGKEMVQGVGSP